MPVFDLGALAKQRRERIEQKALLIASQVDDGASVTVNGAEYWVTTARGFITGDLGDGGFREPDVPVLVRGETSLVDLAARIPVFPEYTRIRNVNDQLIDWDNRPAELEKPDDATVEAAALELDAVEQRFIDVIESQGRRGADVLFPDLGGNDGDGFEMGF